MEYEERALSEACEILIHNQNFSDSRHEKRRNETPSGVHNRETTQTREGRASPLPFPSHYSSYTTTKTQ
jgi:hypothetical protein